MVTETQDAIQGSARSIQNAPSRLEKIAFSTAGAVSGVALTGAFLYDPLRAVDTAAFAAGAVAVGTVVYLSDKTRDVRRKLQGALAGSALIASLATGAGYGLSSYGHRINAVRPFQADEEQGLVIETPRASSMYLLRDKTNYISFDEAKKQDLRAVDSSYTQKEQEIKARYDKILRATRSTNRLETSKTQD